MVSQSGGIRAEGVAFRVGEEVGVGVGDQDSSCTR